MNDRARGAKGWSAKERASPKSGESKSGRSKWGLSKSSLSKSGESKSGLSKSGESKWGLSKSGESKWGLSKSGESKSGESKSGQARPDNPKSRFPVGRKLSSTLWLQRQARDPFVAEAKRHGYLSRAAFKLIGLDDKSRLLRAGSRVLDLGAAPGGWSQVAAERVGEKGRVVAIDLKEMAPIPGVTAMVLDAFAPEAEDRIRVALGGTAHVVLSDMSPAATGHGATDRLRSAGLAECAIALAVILLAPGGSIALKLLEGPDSKAVETMLKAHFAAVRREKPPASRADSSEYYFVAKDFRGR